MYQERREPIDVVMPTMQFTPLERVVVGRAMRSVMSSQGEIDVRQNPELGIFCTMDLPSFDTKGARIQNENALHAKGIIAPFLTNALRAAIILEGIAAGAVADSFPDRECNLNDASRLIDFLTSIISLPNDNATAQDAALVAQQMYSVSSDTYYHSLKKNYFPKATFPKQGEEVHGPVVQSLTVADKCSGLALKFVAFPFQCIPYGDRTLNDAPPELVKDILLERSRGDLNQYGRVDERIENAVKHMETPHVAIQLLNSDGTVLSSLKGLFKTPEKTIISKNGKPEKRTERIFTMRFVDFEDIGVVEIPAHCDDVLMFAQALKSLDVKRPKQSEVAGYGFSRRMR